MIDSFMYLSTTFLIAIGKPSELIPGQRNLANALKTLNPDRYGWLVPLSMPKLHTLIAHVPYFVQEYGYWGFFQKNHSSYFQIVSLATRPWLLSSPLLHAEKRKLEIKITSADSHDV